MSSQHVAEAHPRLGRASLILALLAGAATAAGAGCKRKAKDAARLGQDAIAKNSPGARAELPMMVDDYPAALARARQEGRPLFVDAWAPWCHTCLSMRHYVLSDPRMLALADRAIWLAVNTEKPSSAPFLARFPVDALPTFFMIDAEHESVLGRWLGSGSPEQMSRFVEDSAAGRAPEGGADGGASAAGPAAELARGMRAANERDLAGAEAAFRKAVELAPRGWPRLPEALISVAQVLYKTGQNGPCVDFAIQWGERTGQSSIASDFCSYALECAGALPDDDPRKRRVQSDVATRLARLTADHSAPLTADDLGDAWAILADARKALGDEKAARWAHEQRVIVLDWAADHAPSAEAASTYDNARADSYLELGKGELAVGLLTRSEKALPADYNPPARLARVLHELGRDAEAKLALGRALDKAYGPRKLGFYKLQVDILTKLGDRAGALAALQQEVSGWEALPAAQQKPRSLESARARLAAATDTAQSAEVPPKRPPPGKQPRPAKPPK